MNARATVPAATVIPHLRALEARGWSREAISTEAGVAATVATGILNGNQAGVEVWAADAFLSIDPSVGVRRPTPKGYVPAEPSRRRYQALQAIGWTQADIGVLDARQLRAGTTRYVMQATADALATTYERLRHTEGPSIKTRTQAARSGWLPPSAWDDIDTDPDPRAGDPDPEPEVVDAVVVQRVVESEFHGVEGISPLERREIVRQLLLRPEVTQKHMAARCRVDERTIVREVRAIRAEGNLTGACRYGQHLHCNGWDAPPGEGTDDTRCTCTCHRIGK